MRCRTCGRWYPNSAMLCQHCHPVLSAALLPQPPRWPDVPARTPPNAARRAAIVLAVGQEKTP